jgi:hypothetical protein
MSAQRKSTFSGSSSNRFLEEQGVLDEVDAAEGIQQGLADAKQGKIRPAREFFAEFEDAHADLKCK